MGCNARLLSSSILILPNLLLPSAVLTEERNERKRERFEKICKTIFRNLDYVSKPF
jgi:hypothetical protein